MSRSRELARYRTAILSKSFLQKLPKGFRSIYTYRVSSALSYTSCPRSLPPRTALPLLRLPPSSDSAALCSTFRSISTHGAASAGAGASSRRTVGRCGDGEIHLHGTCLSFSLSNLHAFELLYSISSVGRIQKAEAFGEKTNLLQFALLP